MWNCTAELLPLARLRSSELVRPSASRSPDPDGRVRPQLIEASVELEHQPPDPSLHTDASAGELRQARRALSSRPAIISVSKARPSPGLAPAASRGSLSAEAISISRSTSPGIRRRIDQKSSVSWNEADCSATQLELEEVGGRLGRAREQHDGGNEPDLVRDDLVDAGRQRVEEEMPLLVGDRAGDGELGDLVGVDASRFEAARRSSAPVHLGPQWPRVLLQPRGSRSATSAATRREEANERTTIPSLVGDYSGGPGVPQTAASALPPAPSPGRRRPA